MNLHDDAIENFLGTIHGLTLEEVMANAELDAQAARWSRATVRALGVRIRAHFAKKRA